ncbi:hypothetical protein GFS31_24830 [Leptolyngbya sp. BL0902]|nr:hypothetical protein GFS31_24830 [Leptolyngbya sp. BL0902]
MYLGGLTQLPGQNPKSAHPRRLILNPRDIVIPGREGCSKTGQSVGILDYAEGGFVTQIYASLSSVTVYEMYY